MRWESRGLGSRLPRDASASRTSRSKWSSPAPAPPAATCAASERVRRALSALPRLFVFDAVAASAFERFFQSFIPALDPFRYVYMFLSYRFSPLLSCVGSTLFDRVRFRQRWPADSESSTSSVCMPVIRLPDSRSWDRRDEPALQLSKPGRLQGDSEASDSHKEISKIWSSNLPNLASQRSRKHHVFFSTPLRSVRLSHEHEHECVAAADLRDGKCEEARRGKPPLDETGSSVSLGPQCDRR